MSAARDPLIDGAGLRRRLTEAARAHEGDDLAARAAAVEIVKGVYADAQSVIERRLEDGAGGVATAEALSALADEIVSALYDFTTTHIARSRNPTQGERFAVCAVGGYGRGRLAPGSDWDLMFLMQWKQTPWSESVMEHMLYALWDLGVKVGYSVRSVDQAMRMAFADWTALTAMMDLRALSGDRDVADQLSSRLRDEALKGRVPAFMSAKLAERGARLAAQARNASFFMVEPDVKEGDGGLRDLQTLEWLAKARAADSGDAASLSELLREDEPARAEAAAEFLWRVRCLMHLAAGRAQDRLSFDLQPEIAARMGETDARGERAVERFMRRYFLTARDVRALLHAVRARVGADAPERSGLGWFRRGPKREATDDPRFETEAGHLRFAESEEGPAP
ncbi:MAG: bifunctional uridylyltransferase/uridylyl-removing protein, partial [Caulobacterales bacterium]|nr:bifunctional uridylyltransferase/uridylyl-removing protein [Caulobacterales bacterium]